jgi:hypothetical protein
MNAHKRLERQLRASVVAAGERRPAPLSRLRLWSRSLPLAVVVSATTVAVAAAAVSVVLSRPPDAGPIPHNVVDAAVAAGFNYAAAHDRACADTFAASKPTSAAPSKQMLATLPILRTPASAADRQAAKLAEQPPNLLFQRGAVYIRYVRQARVADGYTFTLIPLSGLGRRPLSPAVANRCYTLAVASLQAKLPALPAAERASTRRYGDANFASWRYNLETSRLYDGVFLQARATVGGGGGTAPLSEIRQTGMLGETDSVWYGIVPPGVASVTLRFPHGRRHNHHTSPLYVSSNVVNSVFVINVPSNPQGNGWPTTAYWRSASKKLIKTIDEERFHP